MLSRTTKKIIAGVMASVVLAGSVEYVYAQTMDFSPFISAAPAISAASVGAALLTVAEGAAGAAVALATSPVTITVGLGALVIGSLYVMNDSRSPTGKTAFNVQTAGLAAQPNPDIQSGGLVTPAVMTPADFMPIKSGNPEPYLWFDLSQCTSNNPCTSGQSTTPSTYAQFHNRLADYMKTYFNVVVTSSQAYKAYSGGNCDTNTASATYAGAVGYCILMSTQTAGSLSTAQALYSYGGTSWMFKLGQAQPVECDATTSYYEYKTQSCMLKAGSNTSSGATAASLNDGVCNVSFANGGPIVNPFDPDCARGISSGELVLSPGGGSTPPGVTVIDPHTGEQLNVQRPSNTSQGTPGSVTIKDSTIDAANNATKVNTVTLNPPISATQAPAVAGASAAVLPGTGANVGTTPVGNVAISNWPATMNVSGRVEVEGTVTCANCTSTGAGPTTVNFPDTMKIEAEGHGVSDMPSTDARAAALATTGATWMDGLKQKLNPFSTTSVPTHTSQCPALDISWHAWNLNMDVHDDSMCQWLEQPTYKSFVQGAFLLLFAITAITIVLGA